MSKFYYKVVKRNKIEVWHCTIDIAYKHSHEYQLIVPLGTHKPRNVSHETIIEKSN